MNKTLSTLFLISLTFLCSETALACSCLDEQRSLTEGDIRLAVIREFNESAVIFSGEVLEIDRFFVKFKVMKLWKGNLTEEITMSTGTFKVNENYSRSWRCAYRFQSGEKYLVYARTFEEELVAWVCTRTDLLSRAEQDIMELDNLNPHAHQPPTGGVINVEVF